MKLSIGFSPCPNDTYIFDALVNQHIDTKGFEFEVYLEDVQTLNQWALENRLDITKLSFPALFQSGKYNLLSSGSALGKGVGPLLIGKKMVDLPDVNHCRVAIPGEQTTANFLLNFAFPNITRKVPMLFSEIEEAVLNGSVDLGVIIHENRFTYQQKGLHKICDLGEVWEERQNSPIPLGCIAIKNTYPKEIQESIQELIRNSLEYAQKNYPSISNYVKIHSQEMDEEVMRKHIELYVNDYSLDLGKEGMKAVDLLRKEFEKVFLSQGK
jgi:1,4-dihydroxy-6-naphthoate synthase